MANPLVSIIVAAYNEEENIARLLESIKKQSYKQIEIVVVDDDSIDNTVSIAKKFTKYVFKRKHAERSAQRNFGAKKSKGKYLIFLDADMELTSQVVEDCVAIANKKKAKAVTIAERTVGENTIAKVRAFEREMYMNDPTIEVARMFERTVFFEFGGYDLDLTGPEDYDLPYRISKKYNLARSNEYILHHEENLTFVRLLKKKYYYASKGALYAQKHPELIRSQGNILFRRAYFKNWKKCLNNPAIGFLFVIVRVCEAAWAVAGYISSVGIWNFIKVAWKAI